MIEEENLKNRLSNTWLKATVIGSLWASFEIIIGSLLHNLRVPFTGTFLAGIAVVFLIAFFQVWNEKGLIWRAGLICALMKAISPSSVILGPMIGIITEAFILEFSIRLLGKNLLAYIFGGALAIASALIHKIINLIILYGFNLIDIYVNLINYSSRQLGMSESTPVNLLYILIFIYLLIGVLAALLGYLIGKKARGLNFERRNYLVGDSMAPKPNQISRFSVFMLIGHLLVIIAVMYVFSVYENFLIKLGLTIIYAGFSMLYYKNLGKKLLKPLFWLQLLVILLLAMLFLKTENGNYSWENGFMAGMEMIFRALIIILGFSAISRELANPVIKNYLIRNGFEKVYLSLQLAFSALPVMIERNSEIKKYLRNPFNSFSLLIADAENWLESFRNRQF
jgi:hypothetical protein